MLPSHRLCLALISCFLSLGWVQGSNGQAGVVSQPENNAQLATLVPNTGQVASHSSDAGAGLIQLDVVVTDASGKPAPGLQPTDFTLLDKGAPNKIISFKAFNGLSTRPESPVAVILVIDMLQLPGNLISNELNSVEAFLRQNDGHLAEPVCIFIMQESGLWQVAEASRDGNALAAQIAHSTAFRLIRRFQGSLRGEIPASSGLTSPPSLSAVQALGAIATEERRKPGRKLLLWVGPGWGVGSGAFNEGSGPRENTFFTICWFSTLLREARIALYSFSVGETDPSESYLGYLHGVELVKKASFMSLNRKVLAVQSGGRVLNRSDDLVSQMNSCVREASVFYTLSFDPSHADHPDEYHELKVQLDKQGYTARTNTGYYDQSFYSYQADPSIRRVTVAQLEQIFQATRGNGDAEVAKQISALELTERPDEARLVSWTAAMRGKKSEQALMALADASAFLPPPAAEIPTETPPDVKTQQHMLALAASYLQQTIARLPDFFADRITAHYQETEQFDAVSRKIKHQPMHLAESYKETVLYRNGNEVTDAGTGKHKRRSDNAPYLVTYGTFGPVLGLAHDAISVRGPLTWSRWEHSPGGPQAVFRYTIPVKTSLYGLWGCCLPDGEGTTGFERSIGYHGEISIDPSTGAILRLQAEAEIQPFPPVSRSDIMVTYGPVEIGGKTFICPQRSVSIIRTRSLIMLLEWDEGFRTYGPWATLVNDITYANYHMFRGESHVMPGFNPDLDHSLSHPDSVPSPAEGPPTRP